jgi:hypothetical protein
MFVQVLKKMFVQVLKKNDCPTTSDIARAMHGSSINDFFFFYYPDIFYKFLVNSFHFFGI